MQIERAPSVFLSYSHDSPEHKKWVLKLAMDLRAQGVDATLDQWELGPGQDVAAFMERSIAAADRVLLVCSERYVEKANSGSGGVGYERLIVSAEFVENIGTRKFIPIIKANFGPRLVPNFMGPRIYIDFNEQDRYSENLEELLREIHGVPLATKPPLGPNPFATDPVVDFGRSDFLGAAPAARFPSLTRREIDCLRWAAEGRTSWEIGQLLNISERTSIFHLQNATHKIGVSGRQAAIKKAQLMGLI